MPPGSAWARWVLLGRQRVGLCLQGLVVELDSDENGGGGEAGGLVEPQSGCAPFVVVGFFDEEFRVGFFLEAGDGFDAEDFRWQRIDPAQEVVAADDYRQGERGGDEVVGQGVLGGHSEVTGLPGGGGRRGGFVGEAAEEIEQRCGLGERGARVEFLQCGADFVAASFIDAISPCHNEVTGGAHLQAFEFVVPETFLPAVGVDQGYLDDRGKAGPDFGRRGELEK